MPKPLRLVHGIAAAIPAHNVDTDVIMPKRFLRTITREGLAKGVFADLRFAEDGSTRPDFVLNREPWIKAEMLIVGDNFGCGSSREHAVWGLGQFGIRALIGTSFAGIFYDNCRRNGIAAITLPADQRDQLMAMASDPKRCAMVVDIDTQIVTADAQTISFTLPPAIRDDLLSGCDAIEATLRMAEEIRHYEQSRGIA
jgi:3-isopropylmalate/(R)-2-methylmalate dehydratase small subunit